MQRKGNRFEIWLYQKGESWISSCSKRFLNSTPMSLYLNNAFFQVHFSFILLVSLPSVPGTGGLQQRDR